MIVKPDPDKQEYEFWVLTPTRIGWAHKAGTQRVLTESGHQFTNLSSAARFALEDYGEDQLAQEQPHYVKRDAKRVSVKGYDLVAKGNAWHKFCQMRDLNPGDPKAIGGEYNVTARELAQIGAEDLVQ